MAKKKKVHHTPKKRVTHRRRMGNTGTKGMLGNVEELIGLVAGAVITTVAQRQITQVSPKIVALAGIVGGFYLKTHGNNDILRGIGYGALTTSAVHLTHEVGVIHGVEEMVSGLFDGGGGGGDTAQVSYSAMHGISNETNISGVGNEQRVSGYMGAIG